MKRIATLLLMLAALVPFAARAQNTQLSGTLNLPNAVGFNGFMYLSLPIPGSAISACASSGAPQQVMPVSQVVVKIVAGAMVSAPKIWGADCMLPTGLPYNVRIVDAQGNQIVTDQWLISGSTFNIGTATTTQPSPYSNPSVFNTPVIISTIAPGLCLEIGTGNVVVGIACGGGGSGGVGTGQIGAFPYYNTTSTVQGDPYILDVAATTAGASGLVYTGNGASFIATKGGNYAMSTNTNAVTTAQVGNLLFTTGTVFGVAAGSNTINIQATDNATAGLNNNVGNINIAGLSSGTTGGNVAINASGTGSGSTGSGNLTLGAFGQGSNGGNVSITAAGAATSGGNLLLSAANSTSTAGTVTIQGNTLLITAGAFNFNGGANFSVDLSGNETIAAGLTAASLKATSLTPGLCVQVGTGGLLTTALGACGTGGGGGISGLTVGFLPTASSSSTLGNSGLDEGITHTNALNIADVNGIWTTLINFSSSMTLGGTGKILTLQDPATPGDTVLTTDSIQENRELTLGVAGTNFGWLRMQGVMIANNNAVNTGTLQIGPWQAGGFVNTANMYLQLSSTGVQIPSLNLSGCVQADTSGNLSVTGNPCASGSGSVSGSGTGAKIPLWTGFGSSTALGDSHLDDGFSTAGFITATEALIVNDGTSTGGSFIPTEGLAPSSSFAAGIDAIWGDSTAHRFKMNNNNGTSQYVGGITTAGTSAHCVMLDTDGISYKDAGAACGAGGGGSGGTPTRTIDSGAGTSATATIVSGSTDFSGYITVVTGTSPSASAGVVTINYSTTYSPAPRCIVAPASASAAALSTEVYAPFNSFTTTNFVMQIGATPLAASTTYEWGWQCQV